MNGDDKSSNDAGKRAADHDPAPTLPTEAQGRIGRELRNAYRGLLDEPLPDKFAKLIQDLANSDKGK
jgi:hypothetical protein